MDLYQDAYGFTRLRLLVDLFEGRLGLVVVGVVVAGSALLLTPAVANPDAWIAQHDIDRYEATGKIDWYYLQGLSSDAAATLARLDGQDQLCAPRREDPKRDGWSG